VTKNGRKFYELKDIDNLKRALKNHMYAQIEGKQWFLRCSCTQVVTHQSLDKFLEDHRTLNCNPEVFCSFCGDFFSVESFSYHKEITDHILTKTRPDHCILYHYENGKITPYEVNPFEKISKFEESFGDMIKPVKHYDLKNCKIILNCYLDGDIFLREDSLIDLILGLVGLKQGLKCLKFGRGNDLNVNGDNNNYNSENSTTCRCCLN
jgi:hypothetical protein